jgi:UDP-glucose 4-epimerase
MKILITGGAGYVGYSLVKNLVNSSLEIDQIVIYDSLTRNNFNFFTQEDFRKKPIKFIKGEILDSRRLQQALAGVDIVIHLAARVTTPYADADSHFFDQINHWGTANVVNAVEESDSVKHFIYLSSMSVYGSTENEVDESYEPHPESFYGISKYQGEHHVDRLKPTIRTHVFRSGNVYGYNPVMRIDAVFNRFMFEANFSERININGDGSQKRAFIHVEKLASALIQAIEKELPTGTYNVAEHNLSVQEIIEEIQELYPELETIFVSKNMRMREIQAVNPAKIWSYLELPQKSISEELKEFKQAFAF